MTDHSEPNPQEFRSTATACCAVAAVAWLPAGDMSYLASGAALTALLSSMILVLFGVLLHLRRLRINLEQESRSLKESDNRIRMMGDNLPTMTLFQLTYSAAEGFHFTYLSKGYERVLGLKRNQVMADAQLAYDHVYEDDIPVLQRIFTRGKEELASVDLEIRVLDVTGNPKWLQISAIPHRDADMLVWDGFLQDISVTKDIETAVMEENRNFQNLFETIDDFLLVCDMDGRLIHTNPSVESRLDYSRSTLRTMSIFELYPQDSRAEVYQVIARMQSEPSITSNMPLQMKSGATIPVEMNVFQGSWKNKKAIFGVARDVARRQQTENALRESQRMLQLIIDTIPMSIFWKDKDSVYLGCNKTFIRECGLESIDQVVGNTPYDLFEPLTAPHVVERDQKAINANTALIDHLESHTRADGSIGWREISKIPLRNEDGRAVGVLGVWRDVTEQNRAEERLKRTLEDMERFNQLMRGRERRTLELKAEINSLLQELGKPGKYRTTMDDLS